MSARRDRITLREWLAAGRDLVGYTLAAVIVIVCIEQWLVLLARLAFGLGWVR